MSDEYYDRCIAFIQVTHKLSDEIHSLSDGLIHLRHIYSMFRERKRFSPELWDNFWRNYYSAIVQRHKEVESIKKIVCVDLSNKKFNWFFITVGYDDKKITNAKINEACKKVCDLPHWLSCKFVNERHRRDKDGEIYIHHHTHFLVTTNYSFSKTAQFVYQAVKNYVGGINFVDVKPNKKEKSTATYESQEQYINGDKQESKMECVRLDRIWRLENDIIQMN